MANCLVTTLKESVNNDALIGMESVRLTVKAIQNPTDNQRCLRLRAIGNPITIIAKGNGGFSTSVGGAVVKELVLQPSASSTDLYFVNDNYYVEITNKNNIFEMQILATGMIDSDVSYCSYMSNIDTLGVSLNGNIDVIRTMPKIRIFSSQSGTFGDISAIENSVYLQYLYLGDSINITGNIAVIGKLPIVFAAELGGTQVGGSIDELVANLILSENPIQGIQLGGGDIWNRISLGGIPLTATLGVYRCYVFWEDNGTKIFVVNSTNKNYTPENTGNIFCKGYTAQEAATKWPDYTVVRVDE